MVECLNTCVRPRAARKQCIAEDCDAGLAEHLAEMERERMRKPTWQRNSWEED